MNAEHENHSRDVELRFQYHLVAFMDILGQRGGLREIKGLPDQGEDTEEFARQLRQTFGRVGELRRAFRQFFESMESRTPDASLVAPEHRGEFLASQRSEAYFYGFSDSIIVCVSLAGDDEHCTAMNGIYAALLAASGLSLVALSGTIPLRGGMDVGVAAQIEGREVYGPALERAHFLESNLAEYPRLLVGDELLTYLRLVQEQPCATNLGRIAKNQASFCMGMIVQDTDGRPMVDFMGERVREAAQQSLSTELVRSARDFVASQYKRSLDERDHKLSARYFRLLRYMNSRGQLWGLD